MLAVTQLAGFGAKGRPFPSKFFENSATDTSSQTSSYTFSSVAIAARSGVRHIVLAVDVRLVGAVFGTITANGATATIAVQETSGSGTALAIVAVDSAATSLDVVVNFTGGTASGARIELYSLLDLETATASSPVTSTANPASMTVTVPAHGIGIFLARDFHSGDATHTWANANKDDETFYDGAINLSVASINPETAQTGLVVTCTRSASTNSRAAVAAVWR